MRGYAAIGIAFDEPINRLNGNANAFNDGVLPVSVVVLRTAYTVHELGAQCMKMIAIEIEWISTSQFILLRAQLHREGVVGCFCTVYGPCHIPNMKFSVSEPWGRACLLHYSCVIYVQKHDRMT